MLFRSIKYGSVTIITHAPTMRMRELSRKVAQKLAAADVTPQTRGEFATIVAYTKSVEGVEWTPPSPNADKRELLAALEEWLEKAKAGEIVGVVMAGLTHDRCSTWQMAGFIGGYSMLGAIVDAQAATLETVRSG